MASTTTRSRSGIDDGEREARARMRSANSAPSIPAPASSSALSASMITSVERTSRLRICSYASTTLSCSFDIVRTSGTHPPKSSYAHPGSLAWR